jgi:1,4-alpha-glucan branching enzyme
MAFYSPITDYDIYLFKEGTHTRLYRKLGAHLIEGGCHFAVWAPSQGRFMSLETSTVGTSFPTQ